MRIKFSILVITSRLWSKSALTLCSMWSWPPEQEKNHALKEDPYCYFSTLGGLIWGRILPRSARIQIEWNWPVEKLKLADFSSIMSQISCFPMTPNCKRKWANTWHSARCTIARFYKKYFRNYRLNRPTTISSNDNIIQWKKSSENLSLMFGYIISHSHEQSRLTFYAIEIAEPP